MTASPQVRKIFWVAFAGGLGGFINAALCFFHVLYTGEDFQWHIMPMGFFHGALLAAVPLIVAHRMPSNRPFAVVLGFLLSGYLGGWLSWLPLELSLANDPPWKEFFHWATAPLETAPYDLFKMFGLVSAIFYVGYVTRKLFQEKSPLRILPVTILAGVLGSLWFWVDVEKSAVQSLLHGSIWGILVGLALAFANHRFSRIQDLSASIETHLRRKR